MCNCMYKSTCVEVCETQIMYFAARMIRARIGAHATACVSFRSSSSSSPTVGATFAYVRQYILAVEAARKENDWASEQCESEFCSRTVPPERRYSSALNQSRSQGPLFF